MKKHTKIIAKIGTWIAMYENDLEDTCYFCRECDYRGETCTCCDKAENKAEALEKKILDLLKKESE